MGREDTLRSVEMFTSRQQHARYGLVDICRLYIQRTHKKSVHANLYMQVSAHIDTYRHKQGCVRCGHVDMWTHADIQRTQRSEHLSIYTCRHKQACLRDGHVDTCRHIETHRHRHQRLTLPPLQNENEARYANNGGLPPDLSLIIKGRHGGTISVL